MKSLKNIHPIINDLLNYPPTSLWRLLIDHYEQNVFGQQWMENEEPGYLKSMFHGLNFMIETIPSPITVDYLVELHDHCIAFINKKFTVDTAIGIKDYFEPFPKGIRENYGVEFGLITEGPTGNCSQQGIAELLQKIAAGDDYFSIQSEDRKIIFHSKTLKAPIDNAFAEQVWALIQTSPFVISINRLSKAGLEQRINNILSDYEKVIARASTEKEKLTAIVSCIHELELTHPFPDGNCRTLAILLLNKLLLQQGFSPVILTCRDRFDAYSIEELIQELYVGFENFNQSKRERKHPTHPGNTFYCHNNLSLANLLANNVLMALPEWKNISCQEQTEAVKLLSKVYADFPIEGWSEEQLTTILTVSSSCIQKAIYLKSTYQNFSALFGYKSNSHGIHFDSAINCYLHPEATSHEKVTATITSLLSDQCNTMCVI